MNEFRAKCPDESLLRSYLDDACDEEVGAHIAACPDCERRVAELDADAAIAASMLSLLEPDQDETNTSAALAAWRRKQAGRQEAQGGLSLMRVLNQRGMRFATGIAGVLALLMVLTISPMGSFAGDILDRFRVQKFAAITIEMDDFQEFQTNMLLRLATSDMETLGESAMNLADYTTTFNEDDPLANVQEFDSEEDARAAYGDFVTADEVPDGYAETPSYYVSEAGSVTVNVDTAELQAIIDELNMPIYSLADATTYPEMTFTMELPQALIQEYRGATDEDHIVVAQLASPTLITPEGVDMDALREDLLSLPGLPPDFVAQLRSIEDWQNTLVIPVPEGHSSEDVTINGEPGLLITSDDGEGAAALWESDGILFIVGGTESGDTISNIADSLD